MNLKNHHMLLILLAVIICNVSSLAQENGTPAGDFPIGTFVYSTEPGVFNSFNSTGMNYNMLLIVFLSFIPIFQKNK